MGVGWNRESGSVQDQIVAPTVSKRKCMAHDSCSCLNLTQPEKVLSAPLSLVSMQLPAGSILVSLKGTLRCENLSMPNHDESRLYLILFWGAQSCYALTSSQPLRKPLLGLRETARWITPELCSLAVRRSALPKPLKADEDLHFQEGDQVEMRDVHGAWQPALVTAVATFNSDSIPAGSLTVCLQASARSCTIIPEMFGKLVRKPVAMGRKSTDGSAKHDSEDVERWNPDTYLQGDPDKERSDASVGRVSSIASSCKRAASTASQCHSSAGEVQKALSSHSSIRDDDRVSNCHSDPPDSVASQQVIATPMNTSPRQPDSSDDKDDINGVNKTWSDHASSEVDKENSADLVSKRDDLPSGKLDVKADIETEKPEDSMSKSPSDGTTASGQLTPHLSVSASLCASPATMPQPAPRRPSAHVGHVGHVGDLPGRPKATQSCRERPLSAPHSESTHPRFGGPTVAAELTMHDTKELSVCKGTLEVADLCFFF